MASTADTESSFVLGTCGSGVSDLTETSKSESRKYIFLQDFSKDEFSRHVNLLFAFKFEFIFGFKRLVVFIGPRGV